MGEHILLPISLLIGLLFWLTMRHVVAAHQSVKQVEIATHGRSCEGKVVAIQQPFMLDDCTRLYFDYVPEGSSRTLRACHVDRRAQDELRASLPAMGSIVSVRYLPDQPDQAVIRKLVASC